MLIRTNLRYSIRDFEIKIQHFCWHCLVFENKNKFQLSIRDYDSFVAYLKVCGKCVTQCLQFWLEVLYKT